MSVGMVWLEADRLAVRRDRLVTHTLFMQRYAEIVVSFSVAGLMLIAWRYAAIASSRLPCS